MKGFISAVAVVSLCLATVAPTDPIAAVQKQRESSMQRASAAYWTTKLAVDRAYLADIQRAMAERVPPISGGDFVSDANSAIADDQKAIKDHVPLVAGLDTESDASPTTQPIAGSTNDQGPSTPSGGYENDNQIGPRGGVFHYSASGKKVYVKH